MKKHIYISPRVCVCEISGKAMISTSMIVGNSQQKVSNNQDIGFVKEDNSRGGDNSLWDNEW